MSFDILPTVLPVAVIKEVFIYPPSAKSDITAGIPPAWLDPEYGCCSRSKFT